MICQGSRVLGDQQSIASGGEVIAAGDWHAVFAADEGPGMISFTLNGRKIRFDGDMPLLWYLREDIKLRDRGRRREGVT